MLHDDSSRYDRVAIALHWLIALALLCQIGFGFLLDDIAPRNTPSRAGVINLHKSIGIVLGLAIFVRLGWALSHRAPTLPAWMPGWELALARWSHRLLYLCMIIMPLSGYIASNHSKYGVKFFGHQWAPWGSEDKEIYAFFNVTHKTTAIIFALLIAMHVAAAMRHALRRNGIFHRMLPLSRRMPHD